MHDIKAIRQDPDAYDKLWAKRGLEPQAKRIIERDQLVRQAQKMQQEAEAARNKSSKLIGQAMGKGDKEEAERLKTEVAGAKNVIAVMNTQIESEKGELDKMLSELPNVPFEDVPEGPDEDSNVELHTWGEPTKLGFEPKDHADLGEALGMMDFETAAKMSGSRFVVLSGKLSRLDRALAALMLDIQTEEHGYTETTPPYLVHTHTMFGTAQLPKFEDDQYRIADFNLNELEIETAKVCEHAEEAGQNIDPIRYMGGSIRENSMWLLPTAEVALTNIVRESIIDADYLPLRFTAHTPCFRREAGSAGRDTKGMIRQHQFNKVELVSIVKPQESEAEHKRMLGCAEEVLKRLELPYRVVELCTGDLGFGARRTFDIEVWLPSQNTYREISSISNCGDFQARRMNARFKHAEKDNRFVHTLNGSGLAVGRTLVAVLENYQNADGSITVPKALVSYMGGVEVIK